MTGGADLAKAALRAARADARRNLAGRRPEPKRLATVQRGTGREPVGLGAVLGQIGGANGWDLQQRAGSIADRWAELAPMELRDKAVPEGFDPQRRVLQLRPATPAAATMLRLMGGQLAAHLNRGLGEDTIAAIRILPPAAAGRPGRFSAENSAAPAQDFTAVKPGPVPGVGEGAPPSEVMRSWRDTYREHRAQAAAEPARPASPWFEGAYGRLREPEQAHRDAVIAQEDAGSTGQDQAARSAASHARALAAARSRPRTGDPTTLRTGAA